MYLAMYSSFQGNFVIDKYLKMAALEPFFCTVFFLRHALELPQISGWNKNNFFLLICISIARKTRTGL